MPGPLNVLVVDDEPKICRLLEQILTARGCRVRVAHDGLEGLHAFKEEPADVVITDIRMPKLNGVELLRELKHLDPLLNVVVITAYPSIEGAVDAMREGACDFITKPFDITQVQAILFRCQQRTSLTRQLRTAGEGALKLEELNRRLSELNDLKSQFLAALSHEINTPLCLMSEWIYLLSDGSLGALSAEQQQALSVLIGAYERLQWLLQQLIDLMQGGQITLQRKVVPAQELLRAALQSVLPKAAAKSVSVVVNLPETGIPLAVDRHRCEAAFTYLLDNAIRFNHEHGRIEVELRGLPESAQVTIRDTGIGIPASELDKVFAPFYQVDRRLNRAYDGAGVGLTLAKRYLELHGGTIQLQSQPGQGTTVIATIPRQAIAVSAPPASASTG